MKNRVKELRDAKHLTQTGLALKVGSTQQTISKIEREIGVPKLDLALIMADFFNVTLEYEMYIGERGIGETIRILRTERGISREELAERV